MRSCQSFRSGLIRPVSGVKFLRKALRYDQSSLPLGENDRHSIEIEG